jgi:hypothetical protein
MKSCSAFALLALCLSAAAVGKSFSDDRMIPQAEPDPELRRVLWFKQEAESILIEYLSGFCSDIIDCIKLFALCCESAITVLAAALFLPCLLYVTRECWFAPSLASGSGVSALLILGCLAILRRGPWTFAALVMWPLCRRTRFSLWPSRWVLRFGIVIAACSRPVTLLGLMLSMLTLIESRAPVTQSQVPELNPQFVLPEVALLLLLCLSWLVFHMSMSFTTFASAAFLYVVAFVWISPSGLTQLLSRFTLALRQEFSAMLRRDAAVVATRSDAEDARRETKASNDVQNRTAEKQPSQAN